jgi:acetyl-CoA carboxylase alpha subunit
VGGAHVDHDGAARFVDEALSRALAAANTDSVESRLDRRYAKFREMGRDGWSDLSGREATGVTPTPTDRG